LKQATASSAGQKDFFFFVIPAAASVFAADFVPIHFRHSSSPFYLFAPPPLPLLTVTSSAECKCSAAPYPPSFPNPIAVVNGGNNRRRQGKWSSCLLSHGAKIRSKIGEEFNSLITGMQHFHNCYYRQIRSFHKELFTSTLPNSPQ
jgi:hypothetical protein